MLDILPADDPPLVALFWRTLLAAQELILIAVAVYGALFSGHCVY